MKKYTKKEVMTEIFTQRGGIYVIQYDSKGNPIEAYRTISEASILTDIRAIDIWEVIHSRVDYIETRFGKFSFDYNIDTLEPDFTEEELLDMILDIPFKKCTLFGI
jgi:hypothetical protein